MSDTKFPWSESSDLYVMEYYLPWFKKCMADFPIMFSAKALVDGREVYATMDIPDVVHAWFNKWFSQFVEGR